MKARQEVKALREQKKENDAAVTLQAGFRGMKARQEVKVLREQNAAAEKIQAGFKGMKARAELKAKGDAAGKIQAGFKGMKARRAMMPVGQKLWRKLGWRIRMRAVARVRLQMKKDVETLKRKRGGVKAKKVAKAILPGKDEDTSDVKSSRQARTSLAPKRGSMSQLQTDPTMNRGFLFLSPHSNSTKSQDAIRKTLKSNNITIVAEGKLPGKVIDQEMLVDQQYYKMASAATLLKPGQAPINAQVFERQTGVGWRTVLDKRLVFNALDACEYLGVNAEGLSSLWETAAKAGKIYNVGECLQCGKMEDASGTGKKSIYVLNGFFMAQRRVYTYPGAVVHYFSIKWASTKMSYEVFLSDVAGTVLPEKPKSGSIRGILDRRWKALGLKSKNCSRNYGVHVAQSNLQSLIEQLIWMRSKIDKEPYARVLGEEGISKATILRWKTNPRVFSTTAMEDTEYIFDAVKGFDALDCTEILKVIQSLEGESQLAAPTVVNVGYSKDAKSGIKAIKEDSVYKLIVGKSTASAKHTLKHVPRRKGGDVSAKRGKGQKPFKSMGAQKQEREKKIKKSKDQFSTRNHALILVEHFAVTEKTVLMIQDTLREHHMNLRSKGPITAEEIRKRRIVDQHFYNEARTATAVNPKSVNIPRLKFQSKFGTSWSQILKDRIAYNALQASDELGLSELDLATRWTETVAAGNVLMSDQGLVGRVSVPKRGVKSVKGKKGNTDVYICGGDFLEKRSRFTEPGTSTYYFSVDWDPKVLAWSDFNKKYIGLAEDSPDTSLNALIRANWQMMDVGKEPVENQIFIHGSISPVAAMCERMNWLDFSVKQDYFSRALQQVGLTDAAIEYIRFDPEVKGSGRQRQPLSWSVLGMDVADAIAYCEGAKDELDTYTRQVQPGAASAWGGRGSVTVVPNGNGVADGEHVELKIKDTGEGGDNEMNLLFPANLSDELSFITYEDSHKPRKSSKEYRSSDSVREIDEGGEHSNDEGAGIASEPNRSGRNNRNGRRKGKEKHASVAGDRKKSDVSPKTPTGSQARESDSGIILEDGEDDDTEDQKSMAPSMVSQKLLTDVSRYLKLKPSDDVRVLELGFNGEDVEDDDIFKICKKIEASTDLVMILNLSNNEIGDAGAEAIGDLLGGNTTLTDEVDLGANEIGDDGVKHIAAGLAQNTTLKSVNLNQNIFGEDGAKVLFKAVAVNKSLISIDVGANQLGAKGGEELIKMMKTNSTLTKVDTLEASGMTKGQRKLLDALIAVNKKHSLTSKARFAAKEVILSSMPSSAIIGGSASGGVVM